MTTQFDTSAFFRSHGKQPKGWGRWGFFFGDDRVCGDPWFTPPGMNYADAKKAAKVEAKARGARYVEVAP